MKVSLGKLATVQAGYSFRSRLEALDSGAVAVVQMKDLSGDNRVDCAELARVDMDIPKGHHLLLAGDLIFRSRGLTSNAALLADDPGVAVLAAPLLRIRVKDETVLPEYLNWYLSQKPAQIYFASCSAGTSLKMISKQSLEAFEVPVPSLTKQRWIVELAHLAEEEQRLTNKLAGKRYQYMAATLLQSIAGE